MNWGAAAVFMAAYNSYPEISWTWLPPIKNILEGRLCWSLTSVAGTITAPIERKTELWPSDIDLFSEQHSANKQSSQALQGNTEQHKWLC